MGHTSRPDGQHPGPARVEVVSAVILAGPGSPDLSRLLTALADQDRRPDQVLVIGGDTDPRADGTRIDHRPWPEDASSGDRGPAVALAQRLLGDEPGHWIWFLTADSVPRRGALEALTASAGRHVRAGIVAPKLVRADDPRVLHATGHHLTPAGRAVDVDGAALVDQGQLDRRQDVLGAPLAGLLVAAPVLTELQGLDRAFAADGVDGLDLCWRAHLAGHRVVTAPEAVVVQGEPGLGVVDARRTRVRRRQLALARGSWPVSVLRAVGTVVTGLLAALLLLLVKRPSAAADELADVRAALSPARGWGARWRFRGRRRVRPHDLAMLHAPAGAGRRMVQDALAAALDPRADRPDGGRRGPGGTAETGPVSEEFAELGSAPRRRIWSWPLTAAVLVAAAMSLWWWRGLLTALGPTGPGVVGAELGPATTGAAGLTDSALQAWRGSGTGHAGAPEGWLLPLVGPTWLVDTLTPGPGADAGVVLTWLLLLAAPLSVLTAHLALRRATTRPWPRAALALGWAGLAPLTTAVSEGRVGPALVHVAAPLLLAGLAVAAVDRGGPRRSAALAATAALTALVALWVPAVLPAASAAGIALALLLRGRRRWRGLVTAVLPWLLVAPWVPAVLRDPVRLLGGAGATRAVPDPDAAGGAHLLLLDPVGPLGAPGDPAGWAPWLVLPLAMAALAALLLPGDRGRRAALLAGAAVLLLAVAVVAARTDLGVLPEGFVDAGLHVTVWPGTWLSLAGAALLLGAGLALDAALGAPERPRNRPAGMLAATAVTLPTVAIGALAVLPWTGARPALAPAEDPLPAVAAEQARTPAALRTLLLAPEPQETTGSPAVTADPGRYAVDLQGREPEPSRILRDRTVDLSTDVSADTRQELADLVVDLLASTDAVGSRDALLEHGVGYVQLAAGEEDPAAGALDRIPGLTRVSSPQDRVLWRLTEGHPGRIRLLDDGDGVARADVLGSHAETVTVLRDVPEGAVLSVAEGPGWSSRTTLTVDDRAVPAGADIALPGGDVELSIVNDAPHRLPWMVTGVLWLVVAFLSLPFGRSERTADGSRIEPAEGRPDDRDDDPTEDVDGPGADHEERTLG